MAVLACQYGFNSRRCESSRDKGIAVSELAEVTWVQYNEQVIEESRDESERRNSG
jgi:hypothetical protein